MLSIPECTEAGKYFFQMEECARMNCDKTAVALLTFSPQDAKAWLYDLERPDPNGGIMLCRKHGNATVVPMSWQLVDARDPAWPGPASEQDAALPDITINVPESELPSDSAVLDQEFAALRADLPITPTPYSEPGLATARAAGKTADSDLLVTAGGPTTRNDPSLFELPFSDIPAVTPHPGY